MKLKIHPVCRSVTVAMAGLIALTANPASADDSIARPLCKLLKEISTEYKLAVPEAIQAQLVMGIAEMNDYDAEKLKTVTPLIDPETKAACADDREAVLKLLKSDNLAAAIR